MTYSAKAVARRRCLGTTKAGNPCQAWAVWDDPRQLCVNHAGRHHRGKMRNKLKPSQRARYPLCTCEAYSFPHRPGGGLCRWPDTPEFKLTTPAGTKSTDGWPWPTGEVMRVEREEPREPRIVSPGADWTREEEIADIRRRLGLTTGGR
jgi:hypothetical protein